MSASTASSASRLLWISLINARFTSNSLDEGGRHRESGAGRWIFFPERWRLYRAGGFGGEPGFGSGGEPAPATLASRVRRPASAAPRRLDRGAWTAASGLRRFDRGRPARSARSNVLLARPPRTSARRPHGRPRGEPCRSPGPSAAENDAIAEYLSLGPANFTVKPSVVLPCGPCRAKVDAGKQRIPGKRPAGKPFSSRK